MKNIYKWGAVAFGISLISTIVYGQARTPYTRPAYITTPGTVTAGSVVSNGSFNSTVAAGNQAFTCTNIGCRLSLGSSANYLDYDGANGRYAFSTGLLMSGGLFVGTGGFNAINGQPANLAGATANGATAVATILRSQNTFSTAGSKITSFRNNTSEVSFIDYLGNISGNTYVSTNSTSGTASFVANSNTRVCLDGSSCTTHLSYNSGSTRAELSYSNGTTLMVVGSGGVRVTAGSLVVDTSIDLPNTARLRNAPITIADSGGAGAAAYTQSTYTTGVRYTCNDADGCDVTMSEVGAIDGFTMNFFNLSANTVNFTDTAGVTELAGNFAMGQYDSLTLKYVDDRWIEVSRSNN